MNKIEWTRTHPIPIQCSRYCASTKMSSTYCYSIKYINLLNFVIASKQKFKPVMQNIPIFQYLFFKSSFKKIHYFQYLSFKLVLVKINQNKINFDVKKRMKQGDPLSPILFNVFKNLSWEEKGIKIKKDWLNNSRVANNIILIANNIKELKEIMAELN